MSSRTQSEHNHKLLFSFEKQARNWRDWCKKRTAELEAANLSLQELSARILRIQDEERRRIARDLHDSVGQLIAALSMNLGYLKEKNTRHWVSQMHF